MVVCMIDGIIIHLSYPQVNFICISFFFSKGFFLQFGRGILKCDFLSTGQLLKYLEILHDFIFGPDSFLLQCVLGVTLGSNLYVENEPVQFLYPLLLKHKAPFYFCLIQGRFKKEFRFMLTIEAPTRIPKNLSIL
jgi:hypothetical protein